LLAVSAELVLFLMPAGLVASSDPTLVDEPASQEAAATLTCIKEAAINTPMPRTMQK
jgi:hypothetical protein